MKEEDKLLKKAGTENPFTVPENYFESLIPEVMSKLPEHTPVVKRKSVTTWMKIKPWAYMAAMFAGAALIIKIASINPDPFNSRKAVSADVNIESVTDEELDYALSQSMLDDYSLYVYLTSETD